MSDLYYIVAQAREDREQQIALAKQAKEANFNLMLTTIYQRAQDSIALKKELSIRIKVTDLAITGRDIELMKPLLSTKFAHDHHIKLTCMCLTYKSLYVDDRGVTIIAMDFDIIPDAVIKSVKNETSALPLTNSKYSFQPNVAVGIPVNVKKSCMGCIC